MSSEPSSASRARRDSPPPLPVSSTTVLAAAEMGVAAVRIPALLRCASGRLIVFAEARRDGAGDTGAIDVVARVRDERGRWGAVQVVARAPGRTMGNPVPLEAADGAIVLLTTSNASDVTEAQILAGNVTAEQSRRVHLTRLRCSGTVLEVIDRTADITEQAKEPPWGWYATGPGHGVRMRSGRMVVAANHSTSRPGSGARYGAHGLVSEDDGRSWRIGWMTDAVAGASGPNESALTSAPDRSDGTERVLVTCRNEASDPEPSRIVGSLSLPEPSQRAVPCSDEMAVLEGFDGPRIQCGLTTVPTEYTGGSGVDALLTGPLRPEARRDLALHAVTGRACRAVGLLIEGPAGYSDVAVTDTEILVLVETGHDRIHERLELLSINLRSIDLHSLDLAEATAASHAPKERTA